MSKTDSIPLPSLRHVALRVRNFDECLDFYTRVVGYEIEWQPDADNIYLTTGDDNLALHRCDGLDRPAAGALDHMGFFLVDSGQVDSIYQWFVSNAVVVENEPRRHRDGAYSFYCSDPDGNRLQFICHPPVVASLKRNSRPAPGTDGP